MATSSPSDLNSGRLRGGATRRRVWSSDEEDEPKRASATKSTPSPPRKAGDILRSDVSPPWKSASPLGPIATTTASLSSTTQSNAVTGKAPDLKPARYLPAGGVSLLSTNQSRWRENGDFGSTSRPSSSTPRRQESELDDTTQVSRAVPTCTLPRYTVEAQEYGQEDSKQVSQLKSELALATASFQRQTKECQDFLTSARGEVSKIIHSASGGVPSRGLGSQPPYRNLGEDCASISGCLSASKVVDAASILIWKLEDSLSAKIGFIGGLFHTWRCEVVLGRYTRSFDAERQFEQERKENQRDKILLQWAHGDKKGLIESTFRDWKKVAQDARHADLQRKRIKSVCAKWLLGNEKGLKTMVFRSWSDKAASERRVREQEAAHDQWNNAHEKEMQKMEAIIRQKMAELERNHSRAKKDLEVVIAKWANGSAKGLLTKTFQAWHEDVVNAKAVAKRQAVFKEMMTQWFMGQAEGLKKSVFQAWASLRELNHAILNERQKMEDLLSGHLAQLEQEAALRQAEADAKHARAKESVALMVRKWEMGDKKGLLSQVHQEWHSFSKRWAEIRRSKAGAQAALLKFMAGDRLGVMKETFLRWQALWKEEKDARQKEADMQDQQTQWQGFLEDSRRAWEEDAKTAAKEAAREGVEMMVQKWLRGNTKGLMATVLKEWQAYSKKVGDNERQKESAKLAVMRFLEGDKKALTQMCLRDWHKLAQEEFFQRHARNQDQIVRDLEERLAANISNSKSKLMKYFAKFGEDKPQALLAMVLHQWLNHSQGEKSAEQARQLELALREQEHLHREKVAEDREKKLAVMENLGFKNNKTITMKHFSAWVGLTNKAKAEEEHIMKHNKMLLGLGKYMTRKFGRESSKDLMSTCVQEWHYDACHSKHESEIQWHVDQLVTHRTLIEQLEKERLALAEQLQIVYQQLDSVTETLQKELKTKEELATELRDANDQMRKANMSSGFIDAHSIITASRATSPTGSLRDIPKVKRVDSEGTIVSSGLITPRTSAAQRKQTARGTTVPAMPSRGGASTSMASSRRRESPLARASAPPTLSTPNNDRVSHGPDSPDSCDWDHVVSRMREEGRFRTGEAPRL